MMFLFDLRLKCLQAVRVKNTISNVLADQMYGARHHAVQSKDLMGSSMRGASIAFVAAALMLPVKPEVMRLAFSSPYVWRLQSVL